MKNSATKWRRDHPQEARMITQRWRQAHPEMCMYVGARNSAQKQGREFSIDLDDIVIPEFCPVFPHIKLSKLGGKRSDSTPSVDRIDNTKGYVKGNVRVISWRANQLKSNASPLEIGLLYKYTCSK